MGSRDIVPVQRRFARHFGINAMASRLLTGLLPVAALSIVPVVVLYFTCKFKPGVMIMLSTSEDHIVNAKSGTKNSATFFTSPTTRTEEYKTKDVATSPNCFPEGTLHRQDAGLCVCRGGWNDVDCSVPDAVWFSSAYQEWKSRGIIKRRVRPRRIVNGLVLNHELDLLEIRVNELRDSVDYYVVVESNYTFFGTRKPLHLQSNMSAGFLREHAHKIKSVAITVRNFSDDNPWATEDYLRTSMWREGRLQLQDIQDDDLFWISDADEIPSRDVMLFLKHHDGYGEPIALNLRWFLYGFFWENENPVRVAGICTISFLRNSYGSNSLLVRRMSTGITHEMSPNVGTHHQEWTITGKSPRYAGWHCSWCFDAPGMQVRKRVVKHPSFPTPP